MSRARSRRLQPIRTGVPKCRRHLLLPTLTGTTEHGPRPGSSAQVHQGTFTFAVTFAWLRRIFGTWRRWVSLIGPTVFRLLPPSSKVPLRFPAAPTDIFCRRPQVPLRRRIPQGQTKNSNLNQDACPWSELVWHTLRTLTSCTEKKRMRALFVLLRGGECLAVRWQPNL